MPLSPRKARHFPPSSGEANAKEKKQSSFINVLTVKWVHKEQNRERKLSPLVGESVSEADERGKSE